MVDYADQHHAPWLAFTHPDVRDLAFVLACPPILSKLPETYNVSTLDINLPDLEFWQIHYQHYLPRLAQLETKPEALMHYLAQTKSTRLGLRFEALLCFWLLDDAWHPFRLIGHSIKRMDGKTTLGEIDFLLHNTVTDQVEHWEVTLKFYLGEHDLSPQHWLGLNREDTLGRKLTHMLQQQFGTTTAHVGNHSYTINQRRAIIKGRLFYPQTNINHLHIITPPTWCTTTHLTGTWGGIPHAHQTQDLTFRRASRAEWLAERYTNSAAAVKFWGDGLYLGLNHCGTVQLRHMVRLPQRPTGGFY